MVIELNRKLIRPDSNSGNSVAPSLIDKDVKDEALRRLYLGAISIDVSISLFLGRKPYFDADDLDHLPPLLDTYEEMEDWVPYSDPQFQDDEFHTSNKPYGPCVVHSVSTFEARVQLLRIWSKFQRMFDRDGQRNHPTGAEEAEAEFNSEVLQWKSSLPAHLRSESHSHSAPPHQIDLMMAFHAVKIIRQSVINQSYQGPLLERTGCIADAIAITDLAKTYRDNFTLKQATLLTSFSIYLALSVIAETDLSQQTVLKHRIELIYSALDEAVNSSVYSLKEPLRLLKQRDGYTLGQNGEPEPGRTTMPTPVSISTMHYMPLESQRGSIEQDRSLHAGHIPQFNDNGDTDDSIDRMVELFSQRKAPRGSSIWMCSAIELSRSNPLLRDALQTVSKLILGKIFNDSRMEQLGQDNYVRVLANVNEAINDSTGQTSLGLLFTVILLATVELCRGKEKSSIIYHWVASFTLLERCGPLSCMSAHGHVLFSEHRLYWITWALNTRSSTFLSQEQWKSIPWISNPSNKDILHLLLDTVVEVPAFLQEVDKCMAGDNASSAPRKKALALWALSLQNKLLGWKKDHADTYPRGQPHEEEQLDTDYFPIFRLSYSARNDPDLPTNIIYPDLVLATSICLYHAVQIILMNTTLVPDPSSQGTSRIFHAWDICRSVKYFVEATTTPFLLQLKNPLRIAYETFGEGSSEKRFVEDVVHHLNRQRNIEVLCTVLRGPTGVPN
ncbi:predicted protein [Paecilomyces variotii No. 5]|uniref:Transcription factor domain-containing protein n=1 Tax=Byssochlamys spectabilis (strain No. 5 / NBRC 109023) TaxID=1356009 RepID=V5I4R1_BYSSN|nr:predicted protein [Paecilomyces variotii No. 5]